MRHRHYFKSACLLLSCFLLFVECADTCKITNSFVYYEPVYSTSAEVKAGVSFQSPHALKNLGKIYFKDGYLFLNEVGTGIHIIDNRNPALPQSIGFLAIPGNYDLAIYGSTLYADSYIDLVAFDISDLKQIKEINRIERLFNNYTSMGMLVGSEKGILTSWERKENVNVTETDCNARYQHWGGVFFEDGIALNRASASTFNSVAALAPSSTGKAGSLARFIVKGSHLYALDGANLDIVEVNSATQTKAKKEIMIAWDVETIFPYKDNLFFGTQSGMLIYDVKNQESPALISRYSHVRSCDPVVVDGDYAYVTLRDGTTCGGFSNQLEVINISNLSSPTLEKICPLTHPYGLGIDQNLLFVCDDKDGLLVFDATDPSKICENKVAHFNNIQALDVIPHNNIVMMISKEGLYQYDYSDKKNIKLLSVLPLAQ